MIKEQSSKLPVMPTWFTSRTIGLIASGFVVVGGGASIVILATHPALSSSIYVPLTVLVALIASLLAFAIGMLLSFLTLFLLIREIRAKNRSAPTGTEL
jgi:hypothetical protein